MSAAHRRPLELRFSVQSIIPEPNRVVFVSAAPGVWGAEESLLALAAGLQANGVATHLVCFQGPLAARWAAEYSTDNITVASSPKRHSKLADTWRLLLQYRNIMREGDATLLFTYFLVIGAPFLRIVAGRRINIILDVHDNLPSRKGQVLLRLFTRATRGVIAVSSYTAGQFKETSKVKVIHRAISTSADPQIPPNTWPVSPHGYRIGIIGRISPEKNHHIVFEALARADGPCTAIVRGSLDSQDHYGSERILDKGRALLGERLIFEGQVPVSEAVAGLDMVVVANPREPMGRTVIEAQLGGAIAIVPNSGGSFELIDDRSTGLAYKALDPEDLSKVIDFLITNADVATSIQRAAFRTAHMKSNPITYAETYVHAINSLSNDSRVSL